MKAKVDGISIELRNKVTAKLKQCIEIVSQHFDREFPMPVIEYTVRGRVAGYADDYTYTVNFNRVLLEENVEDFIARTVPHEFAHLVDGIVYPHTRSGRKRSIHGSTWKSIMRLLGAPENRCHNYDTTNASIKTKSKFEYKCTGCGQSLFVGPVRHRKMSRGLIYRHNGCGNASLEYVKPLGKVTYSQAKQQKEKEESSSKKATAQLGTKLARAKELYYNNPGYSRQAMIRLFIDQLDMTNAGASTYYAKVKKMG